MRSNIYNSSFFCMFKFIQVAAGCECLAGNQKESRNMPRAYMQVNILS